MKTLTFRADPDLWAAFRSAVLLDGDTVQRVLERYVADYVETAKRSATALPSLPARRIAPPSRL